MLWNEVDLPAGCPTVPKTTTQWIWSLGVARRTPQPSTKFSGRGFLGEMGERWKTAGKTVPPDRNSSLKEKVQFATEMSDIECSIIKRINTGHDGRLVDRYSQGCERGGQGKER